MRNLYQNSVLGLRDEHKTERTGVREYLCDSGSDKNVFETVSFTNYTAQLGLLGVYIYQDLEPSKVTLTICQGDNLFDAIFYSCCR